MSRTYRFTFGPWNISQGADPFGPTVRPNLEFAVKLREYKTLGFDGVQFDDFKASFYRASGCFLKLADDALDLVDAEFFRSRVTGIERDSTRRERRQR